MAARACLALLWSNGGVPTLCKVEFVRITWADSGPLAKYSSLYAAYLTWSLSRLCP
jgi:hypothetical protein